MPGKATRSIGEPPLAPARERRVSGRSTVGWIVALVMLFSSVVIADSQRSSVGGDRGGSQSEEPRMDEAQEMYERGMELVNEGRYHEALERFKKAHKKRKKEPEFLNMVAYSQRKIGRMEDAFDSYRKVLAMAPNFAPAREYLGEAHIQAALQQLDVLRGYGERADGEYDRLAAALREAAEVLTASPVDGKLPAPDNKPW